VAIESDVEMGGTDQLFNNLDGRELQTQVGQRPQQVFIVPLLEGLDGEKMSKSKPKTGIWLTDPAHEIYGKVMSIDDALMPHYFEWATDLPLADVQELLAALARRELGPKEAKERLAWQIASELHSPAAADDAKAAFARQFQQGEAPEDMRTLALSADGAAELGIVDVLVRAALQKSRSEARRTVEQGGVKVDGSRVNITFMVPATGEHVVQVGKRSYARIRFS
ncbi:MAG: tyrosine--tRNA ligase, partial [Chloroflexota bacterium]